MGKRAAIYCRISLDATGQGLGVARQEQACRELCERRGWDVVRVISDNSVSASTGKKRPGWTEVLALIEGGSVDVVVAWAVDRMYRSPRDLEDLVDLTKDSGVIFATVSGDLDLSTPSGQMVARIVGATARAEVDMKAARQKAAQRQRASQGKPWWTARPFGFERDGEHREDEAKALHMAYLDVLAGQSIYSIAQRWNREGIRTPRGNPWRSSNLRSVLVNPRNAAIHTYQREETGHEATWQPIVSEDIYRATVRLLSDPVRNVGGGGKRKGLLTGVAVCSKCGGKVLQGVSRANQAGERYRIYTCREGRCITIPADYLDSFVLARVIDRAEEWAEGLSQTEEDSGAEIAGLRAEESALLERKSDLAALFADGTIDKAALAAGTERITARLSEIADRLADLAKARAGVDLGDLEHLWQTATDMEPDRLRAIIQSVAESITLLPRGKGVRLPSAEHVEIKWRNPQPPAMPEPSRREVPQSVLDAWATVQDANAG